MYIFILNSLLFVLHAGRSSITNHVAYRLAYTRNIYLLQDIYMQETFIYIYIYIFILIIYLSILLCTYLELRRIIMSDNSAVTILQLLLFWQRV